MKLNEYQKNVIAEECCDGRWSVVVGIYLGVSATPRKTANAAAGVEIQSTTVVHSMQSGGSVYAFESPLGLDSVEAVKPAAPMGATVFGRITNRKTFGARVTYQGGIHVLPETGAGTQMPLGAKK